MWVRDEGCNISRSIFENRFPVKIWRPSIDFFQQEIPKVGVQECREAFYCTLIFYCINGGEREVIVVLHKKKGIKEVRIVFKISKNRIECLMNLCFCTIWLDYLEIRKWRVLKSNLYYQYNSDNITILEEVFFRFWYHLYTFPACPMWINGQYSFVRLRINFFYLNLFSIKIWIEWKLYRWINSW